MRALVDDGPRDVSVQEVPDPRVEAPTDVVVRITTTTCGSDPHVHEGRTSVERGEVLGHGGTGVVEGVGSGVTRLEAGDGVSLLFPHRRRDVHGQQRDRRGPPRPALLLPRARVTPVGARPGRYRPQHAVVCTCGGRWTWTHR